MQTEEGKQNKLRRSTGGTYIEQAEVPNTTYGKEVIHRTTRIYHNYHKEQEQPEHHRPGVVHT